MTTDLNSLLGALHVELDDHLAGRRSHSRWFRGLRLHLVCTPAGLPITWASAEPKIDDRQVLTADAPSKASEPASPNDSSPSPQPSGTTAPPTNPAPDP